MQKSSWLYTPRKKPVKFDAEGQSRTQITLSNYMIDMLNAQKIQDKEQHKTKPTNQEISLSLTEIQNKFQNFSHVRIIQLLHYYLNKKRFGELPAKRKPRNRPKKTNFFDRLNLQKSINIPVEYDEAGEEVLTRNTIDLQKKVAARVFIKHGYGMLYLKKEIEEQKYPMRISQRVYEEATIQIVTIAYQNLQNFMIDYNKDSSIKRMDSEEIKNLSRPLLNIRSLLEVNEAQVFINLVKTIYSASSIEINKANAINLYYQIQQEFAKHLKSLKNQPKKMKGQPQKCQPDQSQMVSKKQLYDDDEMLPRDEEMSFLLLDEDPNDLTLMRVEPIGTNHIAYADQEGKLEWTMEMDKQLLYYYFKTNNIAKAKEFMKAMYGNDQRFHKIEICRKRKLKILREAIRKFQKWHQQTILEVEKSLELDEEGIKLIINSPESMKARKYLAEIYIREEIDKELLNKTVLLVNKFNKEKCKKRFHAKAGSFNIF